MATRPTLRKASGRVDSSRVGGRFVAVPYDVMNSPSYRNLSYSARALLFDIALQRGLNNGALVACSKYLNPLGWKSNATIGKCTHELVESGLLVQTRKGARPNRAAWFALAWYDLDVVTGLDIDPRHFRKGTAYKPQPIAPKFGVRK